MKIVYNSGLEYYKKPMLNYTAAIKISSPANAIKYYHSLLADFPSKFFSKITNPITTPFGTESFRHKKTDTYLLQALLPIKEVTQLPVSVE